ncbi:MAG TPA: DUF4097 family beta strand repeat-containing protein [Thermomicrobiales bacterium]|nr:DUF4097 family beta strand repeat-containing protein [Thermomicrobiales bacterium]
MTDQTIDNSETRKLGDAPMTGMNSLTPVANSNDFQQFIEFDTSQPLQLSVSNASGQVRVAGTSQKGISLVVRRTDGKASDPAAVIPITVSIDGNSISIHPDWSVAGGLTSLAKKIKDQLQNGFNPSEWDVNSLRLATDLNYDMRVEIPIGLAEGSKVSVKTASGAATLNGVNANLSVVTASGAVSGSGLTGIVSAHSASGAISLEAVTGSLEVNAISGMVSIRGGEAWTSIRTVSGRISVNDFTMKHARVATVSGGVDAHFAANNAQSYTFSTVSGRVELDVTVPNGVTSTLVSRSASGGTSAEGDWTPAERRSWKMGTGEIGPAFDVKTVSGTMHSYGRIDGGMLALREPLPEFEQQHESDSSQATPHMSHQTGGSDHGGHTMDHGFNGDMNIDGIASWAKDFARDFKKNFSSLGTPPEPIDPARPTTPVPPVPPTPPVTPPFTPPTTPSAQAGQPWTWSTTAGVPTTDSNGKTEPPTPPDPSEAPVTPEPANTSDPAPEVHMTTPDDAEHLRVLEALERGDIDVDEALSRLDPGATRSS